MILPVVVLYKRTLADTPTYRTLVPQLPDDGMQDLIVYDNSPLPQAMNERAPVQLVYVHDRENKGLASAYNFALRMAIKKEIPWLLLLDQDSELPSDFVRTLGSLVRDYIDREDVVAVVPRVWDQNRAVSPKKVRLGRLAELRIRGTFESQQEVMAINSGAVLRVSFLRSIGGFNLKYPLDFLDHWLFRTIHASNRRVVVSDSNILHELSVTDYQANVSLERYRSIVTSEAHFVCSEKNRVEVLLYLARLILRAVKQRASLRQPEMSHVTLRTLIKVVRGGFVLKAERV